MTKVHEFAVRIVKPGRDEVFNRRRAAFIAKLKTQKGVLADREFESFFALPTPDEQPVFIGMTTYDALATVNRVQMNPLVMLKFLPFFMTMQLKAYCFAEQTGGPELDLDALAKSPGNILHIAVRRTAPGGQEAFAAAQARFLERLLAHDGVGPHHELRAVKGMGSVEGITVGLTTYENDEVMAAAYEALSEDETFLAYTGTFETLASQFARSVSND